jgi:hypothetical protein
MQIISDIEPASTIDSTMAHMAQVAVLTDVQPIRASCFSPSGEYFVLGTNSKALKICALPARINKTDASLEMEEEDLLSEEAASDTGGGINSLNKKIKVVFE